MIYRILVLIIINSCLCGSNFVVNVIQSSYQAEENQNITLEWTFTTKPDGSWTYLFIICDFITSEMRLALYAHRDGVDLQKHQDKQFLGRVHSDKDVLREGRIRLHVSKLRTEDSGEYECNVKTEGGFNSASCRLYVSGVPITTQSPTTTAAADGPGRGWTGLYATLVYIAATIIIVVILIVVIIYLACNYKPNQTAGNEPNNDLYKPVNDSVQIDVNGNGHVGPPAE